MRPTRRRAAALGLALALAAVGCARTPPATPEPSPAASPQATASAPVNRPMPSATPTPSPPATPSPREVTLTISGDLLWHKGLLADGAAAGEAKGADYDFEPLFEHVRPLIEDADVSICHVEVPVAPEGVKPAGYPVFAAPPETIEAAAAVGFDHCTTASNHTFDRGWAGHEATLVALDAAGITHSGSYRTEAEARTPSLFTTDDGVRVAVVTGTYTSNLAVPKGKGWALDRLDPDAMLARGRAAREAGADLVLAAMHAGTEHRARPNDQQVRVATALASSGVFDLVYGHHAHVPQPWDRIDGTWVVYGGGNLVAQMKVATPRAYEQYLGRLTFVEGPDGWEATRPEYVPLMMTLSRPGAPARVLDVNRALAEGTGDAERLATARRHIADAVTLLGADVVEVGGRTP